MVGRFGFLFTPVLCLILCGATLLGQVTTGTIVGNVRDDSGAVLPGVSVTVRNLDRGISRTIITDDQGRYRAPELALGNYEVQAELSGFQTGVRTGIKLTVGREAVVDITLKVGEITEKVVVRGEAPLVETATSTITGLVDDKKIRDLPLNGRSFTQLAALQEGVASPKNFENIQPGNEGEKISIAGTRITQTAFLLDGTDIRNHFGTSPGSVAGVLLGVDTVREFSVVTTAASAEYGLFTGGVINAVTRSGTNQMHGSIFEFLRNSALDARNFFDPGKNPPPFKRNQFGFTVGGPIARDKTFFFGSYEGLRNRLTLSRILQVPDANAHQGVLPAGTIGVSPRSRPYLDFYPLPNGRNFGDGRGEFIFGDPVPTDEDYFMVKVDHNLSSSDSVFVRYTFDEGSKSRFLSNSLPTFDEFSRNRSQFVTIEEKKVFSSKLFNEFRFAFNRNWIVSDSKPLAPVDPSLQFLPLPDRTFGQINVNGIAPWGPSPLTHLDQPLNRFEVGDSVIYNVGRHSIKTGFKFTRLQFNIKNGVFAHGVFIFLNLPSFLQASPISVIAVLGYVDPPGELPAGFVRGVGGPLIRQGLRESLFGMYVQDDFRWTPRFTWNLGLRYEFMMNPSEVGGRISDMDRPDRTEMRVGNPLLVRNPSLKNFAPRIGFAWDPLGNGKMSIRAGGGIYFDMLQAERLLGPQTNSPFFNKVNPSLPAFPNFFDTIRRVGLSKPAPFVYGTPKQGYVAQYNLTLQGEIVPQTVVTVGYQGARGIKLTRLADVNIAPVQVQDGRYFWPAGSQRQNPKFDQVRMYLWDANSFFNSFRFGVQRRFANGFQFQSSYTYGRSVDEASNTANSDAAGTSNGITNTSFDRKVDRALSTFDLRHVYSANATFELPFGPGKPLGGNLSGAAGKIIGGWQVSGLVSLSTGSPANVRISGNQSRSGVTADFSERPDLVSGKKNSPVLGGPDNYFDVSAFALQPAGFWGNLARNSVIGPGVATFDVSLLKETPLHGEDWKLQFRAEFFNLLNRPNFRVNTQGFTAFTAGVPTPRGDAGRITETATTSRQIQFALKILF